MPEGEGLEIQEVDGDGHNPEGNEEFKGGRMVLDRRDRKVLTMENRQYASVLQQLIHSEADIDQEVVRAVWDSKDEAIAWCDAFDECMRHGASTEWLERRLKALRAGIAGWLVKSIEDTIAHTTYTVNSSNPKKAWSFLRGGNNENKNSPLQF